MGLQENWENIPKSMIDTKQWLCYIFQDRGTGRLSKPPLSPKTKKIVDKTNENHWASFTRAYGAYEVGNNVEGVGFVFDNGFIAIDLDDCFEPNGTLTPLAQDIIDHFDGAYIEYSPSGEGLHIFIKGEKPNDRTKAPGIEVYDGKNFVTVTGEAIDSSGDECVNMQEALDWMFDKYLPEQNIKGVDYAQIEPEHGQRTVEEWLSLGLEKDPRLSELWESIDHDCDESSVDMSLLNKLAYWLNRDYDAIEDAFFNSPWFDSKDAPHKSKCIDRDDYLRWSITNAINRTVETACERDEMFKNRVRVKLRAAKESDGDAGSLVDDRFLGDLTDAGTATLMAEVYCDTLCYTSEGGWYWYNGKYWEQDNKTAAMACALEITDIMLEEAQDWYDEVQQQIWDDDIEAEQAKKMLSSPNKLLSYVYKTRQARALKSVMEIAATKMVKPVSIFDANPWILNTPLCVIDLRTGERMSHNPAFMCTGMTAVTPEDKTTPLWTRTLNTTFCGDSELIHYVKLHMGAALIGKVFQENLIIANGGGSNGKSTLFGAVQSVMGDYATSVNPELLLSTRSSEQQVGMAMLHGKRLAIAQETDEGKSLCGSMLKRLVSTDTMVAKRLYHDPFNFVPTHTLVLSTNHLPRVTSNDKGTWRRLEVIPFNATIKEKDTITDYMGMLVKECGGEILQWCVEGAIEFYNSGCIIREKPKVVEMARNEYRENEDWLQSFVTDCVEDAVGESLLHSDVYSAYRVWATSEGLYIRSSIMLGKALKQAGWAGGDKTWLKSLNKTAKAWDNKRLIKKDYMSNVVKLKGVS